MEAFRCSWMVLGVSWQLVTDVLGQHRSYVQDLSSRGIIFLGLLDGYAVPRRQPPINMTRKNLEEHSDVQRLESIDLRSGSISHSVFQ